MADFMLAGAQTVQIYVDPADTNYKGIRIAAEAFAGDVELVSGKKPELVESAEQLVGPAIVVGTMAQNPLIAKAAEAGTLNLSEIEGKWECYVTKLVDGVQQRRVILLGMTGVADAWIIAGVAEGDTLILH